MIEININEFAGYDQDAFMDFLEGSEAEQVQLNLPKQTALYNNSHLEIAIEYSHMLLAGQKLHELAEDFMYEMPRLDAKDRFVFYVSGWQRPQLAGLLALLVAFRTEETIDAYMEFDAEAARLLGYGGEEVAYACYDFY